MRSAVARILSLAGVVSAQQSLYGQCGGTGWAGQTTCASGAQCQQVNDYYHQCVPGTGATTARTTLATSTGKPASTSAALAAPAAPSGFARADGTQFNIDGKTQYYAGTNSYWISFLTNNADVDLAMSHLQAAGLKILRVWGFNDVTSDPGSGTVWFQRLSASGGTVNTGANGLQRLDYVVRSAEAHGVRLIVNFVNNWNDYGGINAYVTAGLARSATSWYTDAAAQAAYRAYIAAVVGRYKGSAGVLAWELANEPRCKGCATDVIHDWARATSEYVKGLDPDHMVTLGDEGFGLPGDGSYPYQYGEGVDWAANLNISTLDFATIHLYPESWGTSSSWGGPWIEAHAKLCAAAGKPCLLEEYGYTSNHCSVEAPWQATSLAADGMAGDLFWQLGDQLSTGQTHNDGHTIYYGSSDWKCLVDDHVANIN